MAVQAGNKEGVEEEGGGGSSASNRTLNRLAVRQPHDRAQTHELARLIYGRHECRQAARTSRQLLDQLEQARTCYYREKNSLSVSLSLSVV